MWGISTGSIVSIFLGSIVSICFSKFIRKRNKWNEYIPEANMHNGPVVSVHTTSTLNEIMMTLTRPNILEAQANTYSGSVVSDHTTSTLNEIMMTLTRQNIIKLGVYGSSNAKREIVVEKISRRVKRDGLFDVIVRASVMKKPDLKKIQGELGNLLGLQLREKSLEARARLLCAKIKTNTKILIILDDVWDYVNLVKIGIPFGNNHLGCKILLISETPNVLSNQTDTQIKFEL